MQHHAVLIQTPQITITEALVLYGDTTEYEVYVLPFSSIGIDEVRQLIFEASRRPQSGTARLLVINLKSITFEAQQALLKILEEPVVSTLFLFVVPGEIAFIPTLRSRLQELTAITKGDLVNADFSEFKTATLAGRLSEIAKRTTKQDVVWIENIKGGLKQYLKENNKIEAKLLPDLALTLTHLNTRGASNKMLLENLAIALPISA